MDAVRFSELCGRVVDNCAKIILGKEEQIRLVLTCFLCGGHVLLEDIPGTGKTMSALTTTRWPSARRRTPTSPSIG